jgi:hypothetical protein
MASWFRGGEELDDTFEVEGPACARAPEEVAVTNDTTGSSDSLGLSMMSVVSLVSTAPGVDVDSPDTHDNGVMGSESELSTGESS